MKRTVMAIGFATLLLAGCAAEKEDSPAVDTATAASDAAAAGTRAAEASTQPPLSENAETGTWAGQVKVASPVSGWRTAGFSTHGRPAPSGAMHRALWLGSRSSVMKRRRSDRSCGAVAQAASSSGAAVRGRISRRIRPQRRSRRESALSLGNLTWVKNDYRHAAESLVPLGRRRCAVLTP